jgi:hypothetical protein
VARLATDALAPVRERFAPDRRLARFDVTLDPQPHGLIARGDVESPAAREAAITALRAAAGPAVIDRIAVLPDPALGEARFGVVRVSVANVRARPSHQSELVTQAVMGWTVRVLKTESGWYLVHTDPDGYLGWIEELQIARLTAEGKKSWDAARRVITTVPFGIVRETAAIDAPAVSDLVAGALMKAVTASGPWTSVELPDGRTGLVRTDEIADLDTWSTSHRPTADGIVRTARQFMGVPYLWGGTSAKGFDCSGFAKTVFHLHGIELPRDTDQQAREGEAVPLDDGFAHLRTGDLLFFGSKATPGKAERITHVGIYLGGLEFIHASGLVRRNSLDRASPIHSESLRARLLRVRRLLRQPHEPSSAIFNLGDLRRMTS